MNKNKKTIVLLGNMDTSAFTYNTESQAEKLEKYRLPLRSELERVVGSCQAKSTRAPGLPPDLTAHHWPLPVCSHSECLALFSTLQLYSHRAFARISPNLEHLCPSHSSLHDQLAPLLPCSLCTIPKTAPCRSLVPSLPYCASERLSLTEIRYVIC